MSEATVHEYGDSVFSLDEIGLAGERRVATPSGQSVTAEEGHHSGLGRLVASAADSRHQLGARQAAKTAGFRVRRVPSHGRCQSFPNRSFSVGRWQRLPFAG